MRGPLAEPEGLDGDGGEFEKGLGVGVEGVCVFAFDVDGADDGFTGCVEDGNDDFGFCGIKGREVAGIGGDIADINRSAIRDCRTGQTFGDGEYGMFGRTKAAPDNVPDESSGVIDVV